MKNKNNLSAALSFVWVCVWGGGVGGDEERKLIYGYRDVTFQLSTSFQPLHDFLFISNLLNGMNGKLEEMESFLSI